MPRFSLHAIGRDRPGIVAALAEQLAAIGCNFEDSRMTVLQGQFAVVLVIEAATPDGGAIERALEPVAEELNLFLAIRPLPETEPTPPPEAACTFVLRGPAGSEVVARVASVAARYGANIVELIGANYSDEPRSELRLELADASKYDELAASLTEAASSLQLDCELERRTIS